MTNSDIAPATHSIVLAAGRGMRMGALTAAQPKCLTVLAGRSLLDWQLAALESAGMRSTAVIAGYRKELLTSPAYKLLENPDWATTNMVATLRCASALLRRVPCVVSYGDIVYRPDHIRVLAAADAEIAICYDPHWESLWRARFSDPLADAETFQQQDGWLKAIGERAERLSDIEGQYMGLLKFAPAGWAQVEEVLSTLAPERQNRIDMTSLLRALLMSGARIRCLSAPAGWCEVDTRADLQLYQRLVDESDSMGKRWDHDWRW